MIRIAVFDSSPVFRLGLIELVLRSRDMRLVVSSSVIPDELPSLVDVLVVDVELLETGPFDRFLARAAATAPILLTASSTTSAFVQSCLRTGAAAVVDRRVPVDVLVRAVNAVAAGREVVATDHEHGIATGERDSSAMLSPRERQVLHQIAQGRTHDQIATAMQISRNTVDTYVKRVRTKLGVGNKAELTKVAMLHRSGRGNGEVGSTDGEPVHGVQCPGDE